MRCAELEAALPREMARTLDSSLSILRRLIFSLLLIVSPEQAGAANTVAVEEFNFAIDIPVTWKPVESPRPELLVERQSSDGGKKVLIGAVKISPDERISGTREMVEGIRTGMTNSGWTISDERDVAMSGLFFHRLSARGKGKKTALGFITSSGDHVYGMQVYANEIDVLRDPELQSLVSSFRLLGPPAQNESEAYQAGFQIGAFLRKNGLPMAIIGVALIPGVAWLFLRNGKRRRRSRRHRMA